MSDDRGMVYSKSLERHLYTATGGDNDFTNVTSLRGVFMTSVLAEGMTVLYKMIVGLYMEYLLDYGFFDSMISQTSFRNRLTRLLIDITPPPPLVDNSVQTVVTFDQGGEWVPLKKPENSQCDSTAKDKNKVRVNERHYLKLQDVQFWNFAVSGRKMLFKLIMEELLITWVVLHSSFTVCINHTAASRHIQIEFTAVFQTAH